MAEETRGGGDADGNGGTDARAGDSADARRRGNAGPRESGGGSEGALGRERARVEERRREGEGEAPPEEWGPDSGFVSEGGYVYGYDRHPRIDMEGRRFDYWLAKDGPFDVGLRVVVVAGLAVGIIVAMLFGLSKIPQIMSPVRPPLSVVYDYTGDPANEEKFRTATFEALRDGGHIGPDDSILVERGRAGWAHHDDLVEMHDSGYATVVAFYWLRLGDESLAVSLPWIFEIDDERRLVSATPAVGYARVTEIQDLLTEREGFERNFDAYRALRRGEDVVER